MKKLLIALLAIALLAIVAVLCLAMSAPYCSYSAKAFLKAGATVVNAQPQTDMLVKAEVSDEFLSLYFKFDDSTLFSDITAEQISELRQGIISDFSSQSEHMIAKLFISPLKKLHLGVKIIFFTPSINEKIEMTFSPDELRQQPTASTN